MGEIFPFEPTTGRTKRGKVEPIELQELSLDDLAERAKRLMMRRSSVANVKVVGHFPSKQP